MGFNGIQEDIRGFRGFKGIQEEFKRLKGI